jgi:hypothetical protein
MKKHQMDKQLDAKMWKDKTMIEAFKNHFIEMVLCDQHPHRLKPLY